MATDANGFEIVAGPLDDNGFEIVEPAPAKPFSQELAPPDTSPLSLSWDKPARTSEELGARNAAGNAAIREQFAPPPAAEELRPVGAVQGFINRLRDSGPGRALLGDPGAGPAADRLQRTGIVGTAGAIPASMGRASQAVLGDVAQRLAGSDLPSNLPAVRPDEELPIQKALRDAKDYDREHEQFGWTTVAGDIALGMADLAPKIAAIELPGTALGSTAAASGAFGFNEQGRFDTKSAAFASFFPVVTRFASGVADGAIERGLDQGYQWLARPAAQKAVHVAANQAAMNAIMLVQSSPELARLAGSDPDEFKRQLATIIGSNLAFAAPEMARHYEAADAGPTARQDAEARRGMDPQGRLPADFPAELGVTKKGTPTDANGFEIVEPSASQPAEPASDQTRSEPGPVKETPAAPVSSPAPERPLSTVADVLGAKVAALDELQAELQRQSDTAKTLPPPRLEPAPKTREPLSPTATPAPETPAQAGGTPTEVASPALPEGQAPAITKTVGDIVRQVSAAPVETKVEEPTARPGDVTENTETEQPAQTGGGPPESTPAPARGKRIARGITAQSKFGRETDAVGQDLLSWVADNAPLMSKTQARKTRGADWWRTNRSLYDDAPERLAMPHHNKIYGGRSMPDVVAEAAYRAGLLPEPDVGALWRGIAEASAARKGLAARRERESSALDAAVAEHERWEKAITAGKETVAVDDLMPGDVLDVDGERVEVVSRNPHTGDVTVKDGRTFGEQVLASGRKNYVENIEGAEGGEAEPVKAEEAAAVPVDFQLSAPESVDEQQARLDREAAKVEAQAQRDKLADLANKKLVGSVGDIGQSDMFGGDDLFSGAAPKMVEVTNPPPAAPVAEPQDLLGQPEPQRATGQIQDFGEKIGGARKDMAEKTGPRDKTRETKDERPAWARRYEVAQIDKSSHPDEEGKFAIYDQREVSPYTKQPRQKGGLYATRAEAEAAIPLIEVKRNHSIIGVSHTDGTRTYAIVRNLGGRKRPVVKDGFPSYEAAADYFANHAVDIIEHKFPFPEKPWLDRIERTGPEHHRGNVTPQMFQTQFGFRGGEFGNWNMGSDGQAALNHAFDGLMDLADALGVPPESLSLNGELAIAFGARGQGLSGARAHYERDYAVINLTKIKGAGSAAHEWFHAFDHYLGRLDSKASRERVAGVFRAGGKPESDYVSHGFGWKSEARPELRAAFENVMRTIVSKDVTEAISGEVSNRQAARQSEYVEQALKDLRQNWITYSQNYSRKKQPPTPEQLEEWDRLAQQIIAGDVGEKRWVESKTGRGPLSGRHSFDPVEKLNDLYKATTGRSFARNDPNSPGKQLVWQIDSMLKARQMVESANAGQTQTKRRPTDYLKEARRIDDYRTSDYWSTPHEMGARAFESFVADKLASEQRQSDYLVHGVDNRFYAAFGLKPYPEGAERQAIDAAFQTLFDTVKVVGRDPIEAKLSEWIEKTNLKSGALFEGVTGAPVWLTQAALNGALRVLRATYVASRNVAQAVAAAVDWLHQQKLEGFQANEAEAWLRSALSTRVPESAGSEFQSWQEHKRAVDQAAEDLGAAIRTHARAREEHVNKGEAWQAKNLAATRFRQLEDALLRRPDYVKHLQAAALEAAQRRDEFRLEELRAELDRVPRKVANAVLADLNKDKPPAEQAAAAKLLGIELEPVSAARPTAEPEVAPATTPGEVSFAGKVAIARKELPLRVTDAWREVETVGRKLRGRWQARADRDTMAFTYDAANTAGSVFGKRVANTIRHELNRAFNAAAPDVKHELREQALTFVVEAGRTRAGLEDFRRVIEGSEFARKLWAQRALRAIAFAEQHFDRLEPVARLYERVTDSVQAAEENAGINTLRREGGYVFHLQDATAGWDMLDLSSGGGAGAPFKHIREHATYADAIAAGVTPKTLSAVDLLQRRARLGSTLINLRAWLAGFRRMVDPATQLPVLADTIAKVRADGSHDITAPPGYRRVQFAGNDVAIHQHFADMLDALTRESWMRQGVVKPALMKTASTLKHGTLLFDTYHLGRLAFWNAMAQGNVLPAVPSYRRGLTLLDNTLADIRQMVARGEVPKEIAANMEKDRADLDLLIQRGLNVGSIRESIDNDWIEHLPIAGRFNKWLFQQYARGAMAEASVLELNRQRQQNPGVPDEQLARRVAYNLNVRFGSLGSQGILRSKTAQDVARLLLLAPQWNESLIRAELGAVGELGASLKAASRGQFQLGLLGRSVGVAVLGTFIANQIINYITRGKPTWENPEEGFGAKVSAWIPDVVGGGPGFFLNPFTLPTEIAHLLYEKHERSESWTQAVKEFASGRLGPVGRVPYTLATREDPLGHKLRGDADVLAQMGTSLLPVPISGGAVYRGAKQLVTGEHQEEYPGQFERQMFQTVGAKLGNAPSAERRIQALADDYKRAHNLHVMDAADFPESKTWPVRAAAQRRNATDLAAALDDLLKDTDPRKVKSSLEAWVKRPATGSQARERDFFSGLNDEQKQTYQRARDQRLEVYRRIMAALPAALERRRALERAAAP